VFFCSRFGLGFGFGNFLLLDLGWSRGGGVRVDQLEKKI